RIAWARLASPSATSARSGRVSLSLIAELLLYQFREPLLLGPRVRVYDAAVRAYDVYDGQTRHAVGGGHLLTFQQQPVGEPLLLHHRHGVGVLPGIDAEDDHPAPAVLLLQLLHVRHDPRARAAPGRPEVEHDDASAIL